MPATSALDDCQHVVTAVQEAGGRIPKPLAGILGGASLWNAHGTTSNPEKGIVHAAVAGTLTDKSLTDLITEAAHRQLVASYTQELRARSERMFVEQFTGRC
jgi:hypothetical protein